MKYNPKTKEWVNYKYEEIMEMIRKSYRLKPDEKLLEEIEELERITDAPEVVGEEGGYKKQMEELEVEEDEV